MVEAPGPSSPGGGNPEEYVNVNITSSGQHSHSINGGQASLSINNTGSVEGTNAPYIQLFVCQKD